MKKRIICFTATLLVCLFVSSATFAWETHPLASKEVMDFMEENYSNALKMSYRQSFDGYCGACVLFQLKALGVISSYVGLNGNQTYGYFSKQWKTSGGYSVKAHPCDRYTMKQILTSVNSDFLCGYHPMAFGFQKGTASDAGQTYGHTLLVYTVSGGIVYFTESSKSDSGSCAYALSIDDFCKKYSDNPDTELLEFCQNGAVLFYSAPPASAKIISDRSDSVIWENVNLEISSPGATNYYIGVDRDGQRITTVDTLGLNRYTLCIGEKGVYSIYVTCCNKYGSVDSERIVLSVN